MKLFYFALQTQILKSCLFKFLNANTIDSLQLLVILLFLEQLVDMCLFMLKQLLVLHILLHLLVKLTFQSTNVLLMCLLCFFESQFKLLNLVIF